MGSLFDRIETDGEINVQDRDDMGSGHGWAGANQVFWNCVGSGSVCQNPWASAKNYSFGFIGEKLAGYRPDRPDGVWVGHNREGLFPSSLYEAQLDERLNGTLLFSAIPALEAVSDSSYLMTFSLPVKESDVVPSNFSISGTTGLETKSYTVSLADPYSVLIVFSDVGILPSLSVLKVTASLESLEGVQLTGLTTSIYTEPDRRPIVTGPGLTVNNEAGSFVVAKSSKTGYVYIVRLGEEISTVQDLDDAVSVYKGARSEVRNPDVDVPIYTLGLYGGFYYLFAVDEDGRISAPGDELINILETGPISSLDDEPENTFRITMHGRVMQLDPDVAEIPYRATLYDISGRTVNRTGTVSGVSRIPVDGPEGVYILRLDLPGQTKILKIPVITQK
jgi:hypothetical protein